MIDLKPEWIEIIQSIFKKNLPNTTVYAFGSRTKAHAKPFSDLDLVIKGKEPIPILIIQELQLAFSQSNLPIMVDVVDWHTLSIEFRQAIEKDCIALINAE